MPAIFTADEMRSFREWLPATASEATWGLGGSYYYPDIRDYYFTPHELGYGNVVKFDHDFVGREALERAAGEEQRQKVTLVWDPADVARVVESYMHPDELPALYIELPRATYATWQYDAVHDPQGRTIGASTYTGFSWNERAMLSLAVVEPAYAKPGTRVSVIWGEPEGGAKSQPWLDLHRQVEIAATVAPGADRQEVADAVQPFGTKRRTATIEVLAGIGPTRTTSPGRRAWIQVSSSTAMPTWLITSLPRVAMNTRSPGRIGSLQNATAVPCVACAALWCTRLMPIWAYARRVSPEQS
jgi:hypothetical protein